MPRTPQETFSELTERVAKLVSGDAEQARWLAGLYAEHTDVSFPLAPDMKPLRTRGALQSHFAAVAVQLAGDVLSLQAEAVRFHETTDPEVVVAEFRYRMETPRGQAVLPNVFIMRVREGEILESRDYSGPTASMTTVTNHEAFLSLVDGVRKLVAGDTTQVDRLASLYAEEAHVAYFGAPDQPLHGREELRAHFAKVPERFSTPRFRGFRAEDVRIHDTADPEVIAAEFTYVSDGDGEDAPANLRCCFVLRIRNGKIVDTRDYVLGSL